MSLCLHRIFHEHPLFGSRPSISLNAYGPAVRYCASVLPLLFGPFVGDLTDPEPKMDIAASDTRSDVPSVQTSGFGRSIYPSPKAAKSLTTTPTPRFVLDGLSTFYADPMVHQRGVNGGRSMSSSAGFEPRA